MCILVGSQKVEIWIGRMEKGVERMEEEVKELNLLGNETRNGQEICHFWRAFNSWKGSRELKNKDAPDFPEILWGKDETSWIWYLSIPLFSVSQNPFA